MPNFITSNPALPGIQAGEARQLQAATIQQQRDQATRQDETQRKLASFYATPNAATPTQQALNYATTTPGAGGAAMQLAAAGGKEQAAHEDKAMDLLLDGDVQGASTYARAHSVTSVLSLLEHPTLTQEVINFGSLADKVRPKDIAYRAKFVQAGMEALPQIMQSVNPQTGQPYTYQEALPLVQAEAMKAAENVPIAQPGARMIQDAEGNWYAATGAGANPLGVKGAKPAPRGGRGGITPAGNSIQRTFPGNDGYMYATLRQLGPDGKPRTVQLTDEKGVPIRSSEINKFAGQVYLKTADQLGGGSIPEAQSVAGQLYPPASPPVVTRRYVPGKGFVSVP